LIGAENAGGKVVATGIGREGAGKVKEGKKRAKLEKASPFSLTKHQTRCHQILVRQDRIGILIVRFLGRVVGHIK